MSDYNGAYRRVCSCMFMFIVTFLELGNVLRQWVSSQEQYKCLCMCVWSSPSSITVYSNRQQLWMLAKQKLESRFKTFIYTHTHTHTHTHTQSPCFTTSLTIHSNSQSAQQPQQTKTNTDTSINQHLQFPIQLQSNLLVLWRCHQRSSSQRVGDSCICWLLWCSGAIGTSQWQ